MVVVMGLGGYTDIRPVCITLKAAAVPRPRPQALTCHPLAVHSGPIPCPSLGLSFVLDKMGIVACMISFNAHNTPMGHLLFPFY